MSRSPLFSIDAEIFIFKCSSHAVVTQVVKQGGGTLSTEVLVVLPLQVLWLNWADTRKVAPVIYMCARKKQTNKGESTTPKRVDRRKVHRMRKDQ